MAVRGEAWQAEILDIVRSETGPLSAYDVLGQLRESHPKVAPQTVYRALSGLTKRGQVHRLESMNAYVACRHTSLEHTAVLSICEDCGGVEESSSPDLLSKLASVLKRTGFSAERHVIEVHGLCAECKPGATA